MSIIYIPKTGRKRKKKQSVCRLCNAKIMWVVNPFNKNIPIEYDEKLEFLFDGLSKVYFVPGQMKPHFDVCPYSNKIKQIY